MKERRVNSLSLSQHGGQTQKTNSYEAVRGSLKKEKETQSVREVCLEYM